MEQGNTYQAANHQATTLQGIDAFIADVEKHARTCPNTSKGKQRFVRDISYEYAYVRLGDLKNPYRFLSQAASKPPKRFGNQGFSPFLVDDDDPARHYTAFVFLGFWFPTCMAVPGLWLWEVIGFLRYRWVWSQQDVRLGHIGIRHGRQVRWEGPSILPKLIDRDLRGSSESSGD